VKSTSIVCDRIAKGDYELISSEADECAIDSLRAEPPLYLVSRGDRNIRTTHILPGDLPRQPDERGF
jgi:hypothetical protein